MGVTIYLQQRIISSNGEHVKLTKKEALALEVFLERKSKVISKETLIKRIWGDLQGFDDNLVQLIHKLKTKLRIFNLEFMIANLRGRGYIFDENLDFSMVFLEKKTILLDEKSYTPLALAPSEFKNKIKRSDIETVLKISITI